jgi:membrane dipeptidase
MHRKEMFVFDIHLDLAMNAMEWNRDLRLPVAETDRLESGMTDLPGRGLSTVSLPELRKGRVGLVVATQLARCQKPGSLFKGWQSPEQAWSHTQGQLAWYRSMEELGEMVQIVDLQGLESHLGRWKESVASTRLPIGYILSLEGADSLVTLSHLEKAYAYGLRAVGPAHYGPGRYANGTASSGPMGRAGLELLREMDTLGIILDATHLCDDAFWQAMDGFKGPVWASHQNCRSIVGLDRQFSDEQLKVLIEREAVIGAAMDAWMIVPGWVKKVSTPRGKECNLDRLIDHIDHVCQLAGNARHVCIGSDLDGGYGREQCPYDIEDVSDLQSLTEKLSIRGYRPEEIEGVMHRNALEFIRRSWT